MGKKILVIYNSLSGNTKAAAEAIAEGAKEIEGVSVYVKNCYDTTIDDLLNCDGVALGSYDAFSYMGGGLKDFFDRVYYPTKGKIDKKPCVVYLTHGGGGKAIESLVSLSKKIGLKEITKPLSIVGKPDKRNVEELKAAGALLAKS